MPKPMKRARHNGRATRSNASEHDRMAELLALEALALKSEQVATNPSPSFEGSAPSLTVPIRISPESKSCSTMAASAVSTPSD